MCISRVIFLHSNCCLRPFYSRLKYKNYEYSSNVFVRENSPKISGQTDYYSYHIILKAKIKKKLKSISNQKFRNLWQIWPMYLCLMPEKPYIFELTHFLWTANLHIMSYQSYLMSVKAVINTSIKFNLSFTFDKTASVYCLHLYLMILFWYFRSGWKICIVIVILPTNSKSDVWKCPWNRQRKYWKCPRRCNRGKI